MENELWRKVYQIVQRLGKSKRRRGILKFNLVRKITPYILQTGPVKSLIGRFITEEETCKPFYDDKKIAD